MHRSCLFQALTFVLLTFIPRSLPVISVYAMKGNAFTEWNKFFQQCLSYFHADYEFNLAHSSWISGMMDLETAEFPFQIFVGITRRGNGLSLIWFNFTLDMIPLPSHVFSL